MAKSANTTVDGFQVPDGATDIKRDKKTDAVVAFRQPDPAAYKGGTMMSVVKNKETGQLEVRETVFSLSAGVSEQFSDAVDDALIVYNRDLAEEQGKLGADGEPISGFEAMSRAQYIRVLVAGAVDYDISLEPEREPKGQALKEHHARVAAKVTGFNKIAELAALDPDLAAKLQAAGITL